MRIGKLILAYRVLEKRGIREVAKEIGLSHGTLSRIERGETFDHVTFIKLFNWLFAKGLT